MNTIRVEKNTLPQQLLELGVTHWPMWTKEVSVFPWTHDSITVMIAPRANL